MTQEGPPDLDSGALALTNLQLNRPLGTAMEYKSLWQNYNERQINTIARVKWKMSTLIGQAFETKWPDGKDGENDEERSRRKGWEKIHYSYPIENRAW